MQSYDKLFCYNNLTATFLPNLYLIYNNKKDAGKCSADTLFSSLFA
jgi:hypothetical protein